MAISDKTRKLLWGESGARCAYCRIKLVMAATDVDAESVIGDECHIHARNEGGPRWSPGLSEEQVDAYSNLILLCKVHHKMIDDQPNTYTVEYLKALKTQHEAWVQSKLQPQHTAKEPNIAIRITTGTDVLRIVSQADAYDFQHDELETEEEVDVVGTFFQDLQDWGDILSEVGGAERARISFTISQQVKELEEHGFYIFGAMQRRQMRSLDKVISLSVVVLRIVRKTNPDIQTINPDDIRAAIQPQESDNSKTE